MSAPNVPARFEPPNSLIVDECPYCGRSHYHGACNPPAGQMPDLSAYGSRGAHCPNGGDYVLVPIEGAQV